jgi:tetratricopeptide (TPR) repeat protein
MIYFLTLVTSHFFVFPPLLSAAIIYAVIAQILRQTQAKYHRKGMHLVAKKQFEEAIPWFKKSVDHFEKKTWIDKYRCLTLLSTTGYGYREMGLCNLGFCCAQIGRIEEAIEYYNKALQINPTNGMAITTRNMLHAAKNSK